jgi:single-strand DNA-binding protein
MVGVDGELRQDRWQQDGQNRSKVEIIANYLQLLGGAGGSGGGNANYGAQGGPQGGGAPAGNQNKNWQNNGSAPAADDNFADDIPF